MALTVPPGKIKSIAHSGLTVPPGMKKKVEVLPISLESNAELLKEENATRFDGIFDSNDTIIGIDALTPSAERKSADSEERRGFLENATSDSRSVETKEAVPEFPFTYADAGDTVELFSSPLKKSAAESSAIRPSKSSVVASLSKSVSKIFESHPSEEKRQNLESAIISHQEAEAQLMVKSRELETARAELHSATVAKDNLKDQKGAKSRNFFGSEKSPEIQAAKSRKENAQKSVKRAEKAVKEAATALQKQEKELTKLQKQQETLNKKLSALSFDDTSTVSTSERESSFTDSSIGDIPAEETVAKTIISDAPEVIIEKIPSTTLELAGAPTAPNSRSDTPLVLGSVATSGERSVFASEALFDSQEAGDLSAGALSDSSLITGSEKDTQLFLRSVPSSSLLSPAVMPTSGASSPSSFMAPAPLLDISDGSRSGSPVPGPVPVVDSNSVTASGSRGVSPVLDPAVVITSGGGAASASEGMSDSQDSPQNNKALLAKIREWREKKLNKKLSAIKQSSDSTSAVSAIDRESSFADFSIGYIDREETAERTIIFDVPEVIIERLPPTTLELAGAPTAPKSRSGSPVPGPVPVVSNSVTASGSRGMSPALEQAAVITDGGGAASASEGMSDPQEELQNFKKSVNLNKALLIKLREQRERELNKKLSARKISSDDTLTVYASDRESSFTNSSIGYIDSEETVERTIIFDAPEVVIERLPPTKLELAGAPTAPNSRSGSPAPGPVPVVSNSVTASSSRVVSPALAPAEMITSGGGSAFASRVSTPVADPVSAVGGNSSTAASSRSVSPVTMPTTIFASDSGFVTSSGASPITRKTTAVRPVTTTATSSSSSFFGSTLNVFQSFFGFAGTSEVTENRPTMSTAANSSYESNVSHTFVPIGTVYESGGASAIGASTNNFENDVLSSGGATPVSSAAFSANGSQAGSVHRLAAAPLVTLDEEENFGLEGLFAESEAAASSVYSIDSAGASGNAAPLSGGAIPVSSSAYSANESQAGTVHSSAAVSPVALSDEENFGLEELFAEPKVDAASVSSAPILDTAGDEAPVLEDEGLSVSSESSGGSNASSVSVDSDEALEDIHLLFLMPDRQEEVSRNSQQATVLRLSESSETTSQLAPVSADTPKPVLATYEAKASHSEISKAITIHDHSIMNKIVPYIIQSRVDNILSPMSYLLSAPGAGESVEDPRNGAWISGFTGDNVDKNTQKQKTSFVGGSIGYERFLESDNTIGLAVTNIKGKTKSSLDSKIDSIHYIASIYGISKVDQLIFSGSVFAGQGTNKTKRSVGSTSANAKFKSHVYGAKGVVAYKVQKGGHAITPSVALQYSTSSQNKHKEKGSSDDNRQTDKRSTNVLFGTLAAKYEYLIHRQNMVVVPSVQTGLSRDLANRSSGIKSRFLSTEETYNIKANNKRQTRLFVTAGIVAKTDNFDVNVSYSIDKAKKEIGHMASVKLVSHF